MVNGLWRAAALRRLADETFDVLVVGAGATGAGIARDAALRGLRVALCDHGDFAGQTSSRSSKLIHGGLRYLQYGNFGLVFEALSERRRLMSIAPHLCRPVEFLFPCYRDLAPSLLALGAGIGIYNALALWRPPVAGRRVTPGETYHLAPWLRAGGLTGAHLYVDCQTDDARLVLENVLDAEQAGAIAAPRVTIVGLARDHAGRARHAIAVDRESGDDFVLRARAIVSATGPFSASFDARDGSRTFLRPTLGVHVTFDADRLPHHGRAVVLRSPRDGRLMFLLPAGARTIVGTTDTDWAPTRRSASGAACGPRPDDDVRAGREDVDYLLEATNYAFPPAALHRDDVISTFAGLRPLIAARGHDVSSTSREHEIRLGRDGVLTIAGGKLTTLRSMAQEAVDRLIEVLRDRGFEGALEPCVTDSRPLPGCGEASLAAREMAPEVAHHIAMTYGARAAGVMALVDESPELARRIDPDLPYLWAEVVYAVRHDRATDVDDVLARRIPLLRDGRDQGLGAAEAAAHLIGKELGWTEARRARGLETYRAVVASTRRWRDES